MANSNTDSGGKYFPALLMLFVGSGCAALIYEVVWFHILRLVIGATTMSIGVLLASFMGGMCAGSLLFPALVSPKRHPLRVYAVLEIAIGAMGIALLFALPALGNVYAESVGYGSAGILLRAAVCAAGLLPPTILMGATLPALARWMETSRIGVSRLGMFYGANIAGAVAGTLLAGFYLLRIYDTHVATYFAAFLNLAVAGVALVLARNASYTPAATTDSKKNRRWITGGCVYRYRPVRGRLNGCASRMDATTRAAFRRNHLHIHAHPRRISGRPRHRQRNWFMAFTKGERTRHSIAHLSNRGHPLHCHCIDRHQPHHPHGEIRH